MGWAGRALGVEVVVLKRFERGMTMSDQKTAPIDEALDVSRPGTPLARTLRCGNRCCEHAQPARRALQLNNDLRPKSRGCIASKILNRHKAAVKPASSSPGTCHLMTNCSAHGCCMLVGRHPPHTIAGQTREWSDAWTKSMLTLPH